MATTIEIKRSDIKDSLLAESTNASRTFMRNDGVSEYDAIVIDGQAADSLLDAWREATSKLAEKTHRFCSSAVADDVKLQLVMPLHYVGLTQNIRMFIVDYMMSVWLSSVRPDFVKQYTERANMELDDLLRKLYKKNAPV